MSLSEKLRKFAEALKQAARQTTPKPIGNPVAARATGDLGSVGEGMKGPSAKMPKFEPKLPKPPGG